MKALLLRDGFRADVYSAGPDAVPKPVRAKSSEVATVTVSSESLQGQVLASEEYDGVLLGQPLSPDIVRFWRDSVAWYQLVGGEAARTKLAGRHDGMQARRAELLRKAPTETVVRQLASLEASRKLLEDEIAFNETGFVKRVGLFFHADKQIDIENDLQTAAGLTQAIRELPIICRPDRAGLGPGVLLQVTCLVPPLCRQHTCLDRFDAFVPCLYPGHKTHFDLDGQSKPYLWPSTDYDALTVADVAATLTRIFRERTGHLVTSEVASELRYHGRLLDPTDVLSDLLSFCNGETVSGALYSDEMALVVPLERKASRDDAIEDLAASISGSILAELSQDLGDHDSN